MPRERPRKTLCHRRPSSLTTCADLWTTSRFTLGRLQPWSAAWKWGKRRPTTVALLWECVRWRSWDWCLESPSTTCHCKASSTMPWPKSAAPASASKSVRDCAAPLARAARRPKALRQRPRGRGRAAIGQARASTSKKSLTTLAGAARVEEIERVPPPRFLKQVEERAKCRGRPPRVSGSLPAVRQEPRRSPVPRHALHGHGPGREPRSRAGPRCTGRSTSMVSAQKDARPKLDAHLSDLQKAEILGDCAAPADPCRDPRAIRIRPEGAARRKSDCMNALDSLEQARRLGAPARAFHLRRSRYLTHARKPAGCSTGREIGAGAPRWSMCSITS